jgi:hypothetical protein
MCQMERCFFMCCCQILREIIHALMVWPTFCYRSFRSCSLTNKSV